MGLSWLSTASSTFCTASSVVHIGLRSVLSKSRRKPSKPWAPIQRTKRLGVHTNPRLSQLSERCDGQSPFRITACGSCGCRSPRGRRAYAAFAAATRHTPIFEPRQQRTSPFRRPRAFRDRSTGARLVGLVGLVGLVPLCGTSSRCSSSWSSGNIVFDIQFFGPWPGGSEHTLYSGFDGSEGAGRGMPIVMAALPAVGVLT